ncbi:hypothetical protein [Parablautia muri]|uniref:Uncharacterized protein n=1 Tax=Parablautia muri TaxID=2320879 RepID=A0A9X5BF52_9FIRM|nr:hypothetical protein [Parablautia muri]NBJ92167.1 hypothetical protein [Parablautia muri]
MVLYVEDNRDSLLEIHKDAPNIAAPYVESDKNYSFSEFDPVADYLIKGYEKGTENSYAADLNEKYPLLGR